LLTHLSNAICHVEKIPNKRNENKNIKRKKKNIITKKGCELRNQSLQKSYTLCKSLQNIKEKKFINIKAKIVIKTK